MSKLVWNQDAKKLYETGVSDVALFPYVDGKAGAGVAWDGVTAINENPSGGEPTNLYASNVKYLTLMSAEDFGATVEAYMYPEEFNECDGTVEISKGVFVTQQTRKKFGLAYKTLVGNDTEFTDYGYKLHLIYNCLAKPSSKSRTTVNESPEATTFSWEATTTPVDVPGHKPTAHLTIDSTTTPAEVMQAIEAVVYGSVTSEAKLPTPEELMEIIANAGTTPPSEEDQPVEGE